MELRANMVAGPSVVDVAIIGGGPAGTAAALALLRYTQRRVVVVEGTHYEQPRVGETVSSAALPLLDYLGALTELSAEHRLEAFSTSAAWGSPEVSVRDFVFTGYGHGWHLDRRRFDAALAKTVAARGGTVLQGTWLRSANFCPHQKQDNQIQDNGTWRLKLNGTDGPAELQARQVIDATGRRATLARYLGARRQVYDSMVGIVGHFDLSGRVELPHTTLVEAVQNGWWYSAPLPGRRVVAAFMTDIDQLRALRLADPDVFRAQLSETSHVAATLTGGKLVAKPRVFPAESQQLEPCIGPAWVAAGDAAAAFDPLSSLGIGHALASGIQAARIVDQRLKGLEELASAFPADITRNVSAFLAQRQNLYALERRWPEAPFWSRRHASAHQTLQMANSNWQLARQDLAQNR